MGMRKSCNYGVCPERVTNWSFPRWTGMRRRALVTLAAGAYLLTGCAPTAPSRSSVVQPTRACIAQDLDVVIGEAESAMGGQTGAVLIFGNHSSTPCRLNGVPQIRLLDDKKNTIPTRVAWAERTSTPVTLEPFHGRLDPHQAHPGEAQLLIGWRWWRRQAGDCPTVAAASVQIQLPGKSGTVSVVASPAPPIAPCAGELQMFAFSPADPRLTR